MRGSETLFRRRLLRWYDANRRDLPWRAGENGNGVDGYRVLVSELMLQQTQVKTVVPYFERFIKRFPTVQNLAEADEQEVLRLWQGLGYYSRARNLQAAAQRIVRDHGGELPEEVGELMKLPGVGRYTAGAVASIAFGKRAAIVDGNVARVLCRLELIESDPKQREIAKRLWLRAEQLLPRVNARARAHARAGTRVGDFNSAMMELGATVCTPRGARCGVCPVTAHCEARAAGAADRIPLARRRSPTPLVRRWTICVGDGRRWLIERRPIRGRWGGMWQFITLEADEGERAALKPARVVRERLGIRASGFRRIGTISHTLTHRRYEFEAWRCDILMGDGPHRARAGDPRRWVTLGELANYPLSRPQQKIAALLGTETAMA